MPFPQNLAGCVIAGIPRQRPASQGDHGAPGNMLEQTQEIQVFKFEQDAEEGLDPTPSPIGSIGMTFLHFIGGRVTHCPLTGWTLTGRMTGCYLFTYRQAEVLRLAHVGTASSATHDWTLAVKDTWRNHAADDAITEIRGDNTFGRVAAADRTARAPYSDKHLIGVYTLFSAMGTAYNLVMANLGDPPPNWPIGAASAGGVLRYVHAVQELPALPAWDEVSARDGWQPPE